MKAYREYKEWWITNVGAANAPSLYWGDNGEAAFKQHVNGMSHYELLEKLCEWSEDENQGS